MLGRQRTEGVPCTVLCGMNSHGALPSPTQSNPAGGPLPLAALGQATASRQAAAILEQRDTCLQKYDWDCDGFSSVPGIPRNEVRLEGQG